MKIARTCLLVCSSLYLIYYISTGLLFPQFIPSRMALLPEKPQAIHKNTIEGFQSIIKIVDLSGIWESSIGWKYNMKQKGKQFSWTVINRSQTANGTISDNAQNIEVTWTDNTSKGTTSGMIVEVNNQGKATFIEWDNGVYFHRNL